MNQTPAQQTTPVTQVVQTSPPQQFGQPATLTTRPCPICNYVTQDTWYFCPNCGKKLRMKPLSTSIWRQLVVYFISIALPPFGLFPAFNYLRQKDGNARLVGIACILLTAISLAVTSWTTIFLINTIQTELNNQLQGLQGLGY